MRCSSLSLMVVNVVYAMAAVVVVALGAVVLSDVGRVEDELCFETVPVRTAAAALLGVGCFMLVTACSGFVATLRDGRCGLAFFATLLFLSAGIEAVSGMVLAFGTPDAVDYVLRDRWESASGEAGVRCWEDSYGCCGYDAELPLAYGCTPGAGGAPFCRAEAVSRAEKYTTPAGWVLLALACLHAFSLCMACAAGFSRRDDDPASGAELKPLRNSSSHQSGLHARGKLGEIQYGREVNY